MTSSIAQPAAAHSGEPQTGSFLFSLDTELAWGYFDMDQARRRKFTPDGSRERQSIRRVLDICDEFGIVATWALVGHLLYARCEECTHCPILAWQGRYESFAEIYQTEHPLWYSADVAALLLAARERHEIAFHGYTHEPFDSTTMSREAASLEIQEWLRLAERHHIQPVTVIFPRNIVGHLDLFRAAGFRCYRSNEDTPAAWRWRLVGKLLKSLDHILAWSTPPVYRLQELPDDGLDGLDGLIDLRSSQHFFGFNRKLETLLDRLNLQHMRIRRMVKGVRRAARERKMLHIWAHPWEFQTPEDFDKLRYLFAAVADEVSRGRMQTVGMAELATQTMEMMHQQQHAPIGRMLREDA